MSEEAALPHETPSSAGNKIVSGDVWVELEDEAGVVDEGLDLCMPNWNDDSDICILLGV